MGIYNDISETIGSTPLVRLNRICAGARATVLVKLESRNPLGSVKDRIALSMIKSAEKEGKLKAGATIVEPTSGNTGIGLAFIAASRGYRVVLVMPETMSVERRVLLKGLGAELVLTPGEKGMRGAVEKAQEMLAANPTWFMPQQFENPANPQAHRETTAKEILTDTAGDLDIFVAGVGTGGTLTGAGEGLREKLPSLKIVAVEPADSPVLSGGNPGRHGIQGIGAGFVPAVLNRQLIDEIIRVKTDDALATAKKLMRQEGILGGISGGANVWASLQVASRPENSGKTIVTIIPDTGERYLSTQLFEEKS